MGWFTAGGRDVAAATRGLVIQRVLVDGWSPAQAAASFGLGERQVAHWVAAYRRRGMKSLRERGGTDWALRRWVWRLQAMIEQRAASPAAQPVQREPTPFVRLRRSDRGTRR